MPCDRCGGAMDTYEYEGRDARSCRECGFVDVPVRHDPEGGDAESWDDAISRFQERYADVTVSETDLPGETPSTSESSGEPSTSESSEESSTEESSEADLSEEASTNDRPEEASASDD